MVRLNLNSNSHNFKVLCYHIKISLHEFHSDV